MNESIAPLVFAFFVIGWLGWVQYENYLTRKFKKEIFKSGLTLVCFKDEWLGANFHEFGIKQETTSGEFIVLSETLVLFRYKMPLISLRINTPFPLKGMLELKEGKAFVYGRTPLSTSLFILFWLVAISCILIWFLIKGEQSNFIRIIISVYFFSGLILWGASYLERTRLLMVYGEMKNTLGSISNSNSTKVGSSSFEKKFFLIFTVLILATMLFAESYR